MREPGVQGAALGPRGPPRADATQVSLATRVPRGRKELTRPATAVRANAHAAAADPKAVGSPHQREDSSVPEGTWRGTGAGSAGPRESPLEAPGAF